MNISLDPDLEQFVIQKVESGAHGSAADVISIALRLLQKHDEKLAVLRAEIQKSVDRLEAGRYRDGEDAMAEIKELLSANHHRRVLSKRDRDIFLAMFDADIEPNQKLKEAFRSFNEMVEE